MPAPKLPPCGLFRTTGPLGDIASGRLVYFHNHGDPGPGLYLPQRWVMNRAEFEPKGFTLPEPLERSLSRLEALPDEGFYRVTEQFYCCAEECRSFDPEMLVQLGYNASGEAILFVPELTAEGLTLPEEGSAIGPEGLARLIQLKVAEPDDDEDEAPPEVREKPRKRKMLLH